MGAVLLKLLTLFIASVLVVYQRLSWPWCWLHELGFNSDCAAPAHVKLSSSSGHCWPVCSLPVNRLQQIIHPQHEPVDHTVQTHQPQTLLSTVHMSQGRTHLQNYYRTRRLSKTWFSSRQTMLRSHKYLTVQEINRAQHRDTWTKRIHLLWTIMYSHLTVSATDSPSCSIIHLTSCHYHLDVLVYCQISPTQCIYTRCCEIIWLVHNHDLCGVTVEPRSQKQSSQLT